MAHATAVRSTARFMFDPPWIVLVMGVDWCPGQRAPGIFESTGRRFSGGPKCLSSSMAEMTDPSSPICWVTRYCQRLERWRIGDAR